MLSDSDHCYKWEAVYSDVEFHYESVAIRFCTARQIQPYPTANEASCNLFQQSRSFQKKRSPKLFLRLSCRSFKTSLTSTMSQQPCLHRGIINTVFPSTPTPNFSWASPVFFVSKKNGELNLVLDYRGLNSQTQPDKFSLPLINVLFDKMQIEAGVQPVAANVSFILSMPSTFSSRTAVRRFLAGANIKYFLANSPALSIFNGSLPTRITCDASSFAIGAVLEQQNPDGWHPTLFLSRTLSQPEANYPVIDKEWLAVIYALTKWRHFLQQRSCIRIDYKLLVIKKLYAAAGQTCAVDGHLHAVPLLY
ncbi:hypothetical protein Efla_000189 [Eimeria flavescens]